ncbi:MAG: peptide ABC transporter substrate-binding protein [Anaerolineales bacterium]|nr:peptide ABC transporter substrate-binding protein [Anaerolineales bacterium]
MSHKMRYASLAFLLVIVMAFGSSGLISPKTHAQDGWQPLSFAPGCEAGGSIAAIEAIDELTVKFTLCGSDPAFPSKAAFSAFAIHPSEYLEATGGGGELVESPVGTGPYMLSEWTRGESLTLVRNENYWGDPAPMQTVVFRWNAEGSARLNELRAGTVDGIDNPSPDDYEGIREDENLVLYDRPGTNVFYIGLNNTFEPLDNVQVRQALAMAVDRQRLVDNFYPKGSLVATQFMPPSIFGFTPEVTWYEFDPETARTMLADAGYPDGFEITLSYRDVFRSYLPEPGLVAVDIKEQLEQNLGLTVNINVMESGAFIDASDAGELEMYLLGWGADYPDATNFLDFHFGATASDQFGDKHPEITEPLARAAALADPAQRLPIYVEANQAIKDLVPMIPVAHGASATAFAADVVGAHASPLGNENFSVMSVEGQDTLVWMQNAEPIGLYCADETDGESLRACEQINESLLAYEVGGTAVIPGLAESFEVNEDLTEYTFHLREGVTFHDGSALDANDVVLSWEVQADAANPLHVGRNGTFTYFDALFGIINKPAE